MNRKQRRTITAQQRKPKQQQVSLTEAMSIAIKLHQNQQLDEAEKIYQQVLAASPDLPDALNFLGVLYHQRDQSDKAITLIRKAISINPDYPDAYNNLGNVLKETGRYEEAADAYHSCLALVPDNVDTLSNLGAVLRETGKIDEALKLLSRAIELAPDHYRAYHNLGNVYKKMGRYTDAISAYRKSIELMHPDHSKEVIDSVYRSLTRTLYLDQRHDEAIRVLNQWLAFDPENPIAQHMLAACSGTDIPQRASDAFVAETFDIFAGSFDEVLKRLEYRAPDLVAAAIHKYAPNPDRKLRVLDAGCGTGLCGSILREYADQLVGVDLSEKMIDKAKGRCCYDELIVAELTGYMEKHPDSYHLIACADTLCYFGDLGNVLRAASSALIEGGLLVFTVEKTVDPAPSETYRLNQHGRYSHTEEYATDILYQHGLTVLSVDTDILRNEAGVPVKGLVFSAVKK